MNLLTFSYYRKLESGNKRARTLWHQRETMLGEAIVDAHLKSFKLLEIRRPERH